MASRPGVRMDQEPGTQGAFRSRLSQCHSGEGCFPARAYHSEPQRGDLMVKTSWTSMYKDAKRASDGVIRIRAGWCVKNSHIPLFQSFFRRCAVRKPDSTLCIDFEFTYRVYLHPLQLLPTRDINRYSLTSKESRISRC